ncbi:MAG: molecular chaperone TorD family protein [Candidatus Eremiobacteraeota bacterium]|nr:molecular chaperone TorD family protein [Candidatus Eremiobacteraeota bacterium]
MVATQTAADRARVLELFAQLLDYPRPGAAEAARECVRLIEVDSPDAAALVRDFAAFAERTPQNTLEEVYTATFELNATCHPYIGYHIFGEDYRRSQFLLELKELYRSHDFGAGIELPDHLSVLLQFMAICRDPELAAEIGREAIVRTLVPMIAGEEVDAVEEADMPPPAFDLGADYRRLMKALHMVLVARYGVPQEREAIPLPEQERLVS